MTGSRRLVVALAAAVALTAIPFGVDLTRLDAADPGSVFTFNGACAGELCDVDCRPADPEDQCPPEDWEPGEECEAPEPLSGYNIHDGEQDKK